MKAGIRPRALMLAMIIAVFGVGGAPALLAAAPAVAAPSCAPVTIVMMAGTGETNAAANPNVPVGMLKGVTDRVQAAAGNKVTVLFPAYSASAFNKGLDYVQSKQTGIDALNHTLTSLCATTRIVFGGYSQGADVAGDVASNIGNNRGPISADRVIAVALLADPGRGTPGESLVGPNANRGVGMGGNRPGGMGSLAGRVATICDTGNNTSPGDMYCNLDRQKYPLVSSISQMLAMTPAESEVKTQEENQIQGLPGTVGTSPTGQHTASQLTSAMTTDWSSADLGQLGANVSKLTSALRTQQGNSGQGSSNPVDLGEVASTASSVSNTLQPLLQLTQSGTADPTTVKGLSQSPAGSADQAAATVLNSANKSDLSGAVTSAQQLAQTATSLSQQTGDTSTSLDTAQTQQLSTAATQLGQQTAPLTSTPADTMATATNVLSVLAPQKVIEQVLNVVVGLGSTDWLGIINGLNMTVQRAVALDVPGVRKSAQDINVAIGPLVKMAAQVDFKWIATILRMIPDPSGYTQIAATVLDYVGNLDIIRLVNDIQKIEGVAFDVIEQKNLLRTADLIPVGLDLATVASGVLTGGTKTAASGYQPNLTTNNTLSTQAGNADLLGLTNSMTTLASSEGVGSLAQLVDAGVEVSQFVGGATRNHVGYGNYKVDNSGRNAIEWLGDWITLKVQRVNAA